MMDPNVKLIYTGTDGTVGFKSAWSSDVKNVGVGEQEATFHQFEDVAIPLISKYNGQLLLRVRPSEQNFVESTIEHPYEIHLVEFPSDADFQNFIRDEERKTFLHLKEQSIKSVG